jgi:CDP-diacylglycerol--glycerol-3-phosphate 3-phosphatidyltransferase
MTTLTSLPPPGRAQPVGRVDTVANLVTVVRTVLAVALGAYALVERSGSLLLLAYGVYWLGDILDGWSARRLAQQTRLGAVLDIVSDRACCAVLCCGLLALSPELWPAVALFLLQFMVVDCVLSLSFLCWSIDSPNDFHVVDRQVWRLNWSPVAKAVNTTGVVAAVATGSLELAVTVALGQLALKVWSSAAVLRLLERPEPSAP